MYLLYKEEIKTTTTTTTSSYMQDDQIYAYVICIKKKRLVERVAKKVSIHIITLKVKK